MSAEPAAFLSYTRVDDHITRNFITDFRNRLAELIHLKTGEQFTIFQDRHSLEWGAHWPDAIDAAITNALFLIPFVTPNFIHSEACLDEVRRFLEIERKQNRKDLILPVYFVKTPELERDDLRTGNEIATELHFRQYHDLRAYASKRVSSAAVEAELQILSDKIERSLQDHNAESIGPGPPQRRIFRQPPGFAPAEVRDREPTIAALTEMLDYPKNRLIEIKGDAGIGKTAVIAKLFLELPAPVALDYLSTQGRPGVSVSSVLSSLARAHPSAAKGAALDRRVGSSNLTLFERLDEILRELGTTNVLLVLDNLEAILDGQQKLRDRPLSTLLEEIARVEGHRIKILLVTTKHWNNPYVRNLTLYRGLEQPYLARFIADLDAARDGRIASFSPRDATRLETITAGQPRSIELVHDILTTQGTSISRLATLDRPIIDVLAKGMSDDELAVVRALAAYARPISPAAITHLTGPDRAVKAILESLARRRIVRRLAEDIYLLPEPTDAFADPETLAVLRGKAAEYFEEGAGASNQAAQSLDDLADLLNALDLRIAEGNADRALDLAVQLDTDYLKNWGRSDVLLTPLLDLLPMLTDPNDRVLTGSLIGRALIHLGQLDDAIRVLLAAKAGNDLRCDPERQLILMTQLGYCHFRDGRTTLAREHYQGGVAVTPAMDATIAVLSARHGLALCHMELGEFAEALTEVELARHELADCSASEDARTELDIQLSSCEAAIHLEFGHTQIALDLTERARSAAEGIRAHVLAGDCHEVAARAWQIEDNLAAAIGCAESASAIAARTRNPDLTRSSGVTLATLLLLQGREEEAAAVADAAARYTRRRHVLDIFVVQGIAALRTGRIETAERAFSDAETLADALLRKEPSNYRVLEYRGITLAALSHLHQDTREQEAADALRAARDLCGDLRGSNRQREDLFRILADGLPEGTLPLVHAVVG